MSQPDSKTAAPSSSWAQRLGQQKAAPWVWVFKNSMVVISDEMGGT
jgi:hypothetical protein